MADYHGGAIPRPPSGVGSTNPTTRSHPAPRSFRAAA